MSGAAPAMSIPGGFVSERVTFSDISPRAWEHPADRAALDALRRVPGFDALVRRLFGVFSERALRLITAGSAVEVGPDQFPRIYAVYTDVLATLDAPRPWPLYLAQNPIVNAGAVGMDQPFIVLSSGTVHLLDDDQLRVVLGHEVGHIMSDHALYKTMLHLLLKAGLMVLRLPLSGIPMLAVLAALLEWDRKSELSADRASLLATQDPDAVQSALLRMAGGVGEGASIDAFRAQAARFHEDPSALDVVVKTLAVLGRRHPFPVERLHELDRWVDSGEYDRIVGGDYPRRTDTPLPTRQTWKETAQGYAEGFKASIDPLGRWFRDTSASVAERVGNAFGWFKREPGDDEEGEGHDS